MVTVDTVNSPESATMVNPADLFKEDNPQRSRSIATDISRRVLAELGIADKPGVKDLDDGLTRAQSMGLTRDDLDVIYSLGFQKMTGADFKAAEDVFAFLSINDPLHAPNYYCLAVARQAQGKYDEAEMAIYGFLAMDATNPNGYLRLGECRQARGDRGGALEAYKLAEAECRNGHGDAVTLEEARAKRALAEQEHGA